MCSELDPPSQFKRLQMGIFGFPQRETGPKIVAMATTCRCHFVSFVMYVSGAKFEEYYSNMSGDILD